MSRFRLFRSTLLSLALSGLLLVNPASLQASTILALQASVTKTAAFDGSSIDVSGLTAGGEFAVELNVSALSSASGTPTVTYSAWIKY